MTQPKIRNYFSKPVSKAKMSQDVCAQQQFKDECDVNTIVKRYAQTGDHRLLNSKTPNFGVHDSTTFQEAMNVVTSAQQQFEQIPAHIRKKFNNDPALFMDFVHNPDNTQALYDMGLLDSLPSFDADSAQAEIVSEKVDQKTAEQASTESTES